MLLLALAIFLPHLEAWQLSSLYFSMSLCFGTIMGVLQVTVQNVAGRNEIGAAASAVQFSRSLGATMGTSLVSAAVFIALQSGDGTATTIFRQALEGNAQALSGNVATAVQRELAGAFQPAFLVIAAFAAIGSILAWSIPVRSIEFHEEDDRR